MARELLSVAAASQRAVYQTALHSALLSLSPAYAAEVAAAHDNTTPAGAEEPFAPGAISPQVGFRVISYLISHEYYHSYAYAPPCINLTHPMMNIGTRRRLTTKERTLGAERSVAPTLEFSKILSSPYD
eukprot:2753242-Pyramimonas_sp.AAC.2